MNPVLIIAWTLPCLLAGRIGWWHVHAIGGIRGIGKPVNGDVVVAGVNGTLQACIAILPHKTIELALRVDAVDWIAHCVGISIPTPRIGLRSEERRVGKECRS